MRANRIGGAAGQLVLNTVATVARANITNQNVKQPLENPWSKAPAAAAVYTVPRRFANAHRGENREGEKTAGIATIVSPFPPGTTIPTIRATTSTARKVSPGPPQGLSVYAVSAVG
jgi:hypothetical protein